MGTLTYKGILIPDAADTTDGADVQNTLAPGLKALATIAVALSAARVPTANDDGVGTGGLSPIAPPGFFVNTATTPPTIFQCTSAATGAAVWQQIFPALASANSLLQATVVATSALPSNTYANGTAGVGATLTATAHGVLTVDGHAVALNDVVLVTEAAPANNGVYVCTTAGASGAYYVLTRVTWMDLAAQFVGAIIPVGPAGTANANTLWQCQATAAPTIGTTAISFAEMSPPTSLEYSDSNPLIDANNHLVDDPANVPTIVDYTGGGATISGSDQGFVLNFASVTASGGLVELGEFAFANPFSGDWFPTVSLGNANAMTDQGHPVVASFVNSGGAPYVLQLNFPSGDTITSGSYDLYVNVRGD